MKKKHARPRAKRKGIKAMAGPAMKATMGAFATRETRICKAAKKAGWLGMSKEGRSRLFIAGVLPIALYGAEHEP